MTKLHVRKILHKGVEFSDVVLYVQLQESNQKFYFNSNLQLV